MFQSFIVENEEFITWGGQHGWVIAVFLMIGIMLIFRGRKTNEESKWRMLRGMAGVMCATVIIWTIIELATGRFDIKEDLPLVICNFMAFAMPVFAHTRNKLVFEIIYFWILVATIQAIITPDLKNGFPNYTFFKYWIVHCGLVVVLFYAIFVLKFRPVLKSILWSFLALEAYIIIMFGINDLLDANYMYLNHKPEMASALDAMGDWPQYIITAHLIVLPVFFLFYSPYLVMDLQKNFMKRNKP